MEARGCVSAAARGLPWSPLISSPQSQLLPLPFIQSRNNKAFIAAALSADSAAATAPLVRSSSPSSFKQLIEGLIGGVDLTEEEAEASVDLLLDEGNEALVSAFLVLLRAKGETFQEIVGLARAMFKRCRQVQGLEDVVDIVGTGGDGADTVNISTGTVAHLVGAFEKMEILAQTELI